MRANAKFLGRERKKTSVEILDAMKSGVFTALACPRRAHRPARNCRAASGAQIPPTPRVQHKCTQGKTRCFYRVIVLLCYS